ncbi:hypothetical protein [Pseudomonas sp. NPDC088444]|uniref:hypothetical protein n=1 Tax=Pseudomonas sp. NPDC088444 TaxID=3364456 RepID=UPI003850C7B9
MFNWKDGLEFRTEYFGTFMGSIYIGMASCFFTLLLAISSYLNDTAFVDQAKWFCVLSLLFAVYQTFVCFMISQGRAKWVRALVGMCMLFFVVDLFSILYAPSFVLYILALACSLLALGFLKSTRYERMLVWLEEKKEMRKSLG